LANIIFEYAYPTPQPTNTPDPAVPTPQPTNTPDPSISATPTVTGTPTPAQQVQGARYEAFQYLIKETERWSDVEIVRFNDASETDIVITFISPELLQAVLLNNTLKDGVVTSDFQGEVQKALTSVAARGELLFMFTVMSPGTNPNSHTVTIPVGNLALNNTESQQLTPSHYDPNLVQPIKFSSESVFGYIAYPQVRLLNDQCKWTLDPKYNTNIVITMEKIQVDGIDSGPYSWTIPYAPLLRFEQPPELPSFLIPQNYDQKLIAPLETLQAGFKVAGHWQDFARFVWFKTTLRY
jgi:hypothetical protein